MIPRRGAKEIELIREACRIVYFVQQQLEAEFGPDELQAALLAAAADQARQDAYQAGTELVQALEAAAAAGGSDGTAPADLRAAALEVEEAMRQAEGGEEIQMLD